MIPVSTKWVEGIREQFRYQGYLRVSLEVVPPGLQEGLKYDTDATEQYSSKDAIADNTGKQPKAYSTLESNRWLLNGKFTFVDKDTVVDDWWSTLINKGFKVIQFTFDQVYTIPGIFVDWDLVDNTYPDSILIEGFGNDGAKAYSYDVDSITSSSGFVDAPMDNVKSVTLTIKSWNVDNWRCRIDEILFGLKATYDSINSGRVMDAESYDYSSPISQDLPKHTMSISLRNLDKEFDPSLKVGISKYLARRQLVQYQWGFTYPDGEVEWTPKLDYYLDSFSIPADSKEVSLDATSRLAFLTQDFKKDVYEGTERTLYQIAQYVLENSGVIYESKVDVPWELAEKLKSIKTTAPVPKKAVNSVLQYIANAATCWLKTNAVNGYIQLADLGTETLADNNQQLGMMQQLGDPEIDVQEILYKLSIGVHKYTKSDEQTVLSQGEYTVTGKTTLNIDYSSEFALGVTCSVEGATLVKFTPYATSAEVIVQSSGASSVATITLKGYSVTKSISYIQTYQDPSITHGLEVTIENPFITDTTNLEELTNWFVAWYNKRQSFTIPYTGYPEVVAGDHVDLTTEYGEEPNSRVLGNKITFNGGFNGTMEVR